VVGDTGFGSEFSMDRYRWAGVAVGGFDDVVTAMWDAPVGAAAGLRFTPPGEQDMHAVLVWKFAEGQVAFLDAQTGGLAKLPEGATDLKLAPFSKGIAVTYTRAPDTFFIPTSPDSAPTSPESMFRRVGVQPGQESTDSTGYQTIGESTF